VRLCVAAELTSALARSDAALMVANYGLRAVVDSLRVRCRFGMMASAEGDGWAHDAHACTAVLALSDVAAHEASCDFQIVVCANASLRGARCGAEHQRGEADAHSAVCSLRPSPCTSGCGAQLALCDAAEHAAVCPEALVRCTFFGCQASMRRCELAKHDADSMAAHLRAEREAREACTQGLAITPATGVFAALKGATSAEQAERALTQLVPFLVSKRSDWPACIRVLAAMETHAAHAGTQLQGLKCLRFLAPWLSRAEFVAMQTDNMDVGAPPVRVLLDAMRTHLADGGVQEWALAALAAGGIFVGAAENDTCAAAAVAALQAHASLAGVQETGLLLLANGTQGRRPQAAGPLRSVRALYRQLWAPFAGMPHTLACSSRRARLCGGSARTTSNFVKLQAMQEPSRR
jgi:hypothetical protein